MDTLLEFFTHVADRSLVYLTYLEGLSPPPLLPVHPTLLSKPLHKTSCENSCGSFLALLRGLQENTVSPNFATLSESLYIAERKAREETRLRGEMLKQVAMREKDQKEADLRDLAARARLERAGIGR